MKRKKLWPDLVSYNTAMDVLQKSSSWREALEMWRTMPPSPDVVTMNTAMLALVSLGRCFRFFSRKEEGRPGPTEHRPGPNEKI